MNHIEFAHMKDNSMRQSYMQREPLELSPFLSCVIKSLKRSGGSSGCNGEWKHISRDHRIGADYTTIPNSYPWHDHDSISKPYVLPDYHCAIMIKIPQPGRKVDVLGSLLVL